MESIIRWSVQHKLLILIGILGLIGAGYVALRDLPLDAVPDITNNQVQVVTISQTLAAQEVEQLITYPVEMALANLPGVEEIRSVSRFGLSVVTVVFSDNTPMLDARQLVKEQISIAAAEIPSGIGTPELMPITTGLGEIYQYVLVVQPGYEGKYNAMDVRTIQDWIVKRQLSGIPGIIEVSSFGGFLKQYEVALDPSLMRSMGVTIPEVFEVLSRNNENSGGGYIEKNHRAYYIRTQGLVQSPDEIEQLLIQLNDQGSPIRIRDVGTVQLGSAPRFGAMTMDGKGEAVGGITLMLKGANSSQAVANVRDRVKILEKSLPEGIALYPYLDRSNLVAKTIHTVEKNLLEGGIIVIVVLILLLGNLRAGILVASVIPLAMLFAIIMMRIFGVSANLMSLGAIDFGIVVDGAVIVVEGVLYALFAKHLGKQLTQAEMDEEVASAAGKLFRSAVFGVVIILVVFVPVMTLTGIEGKMFRPMAMTFSFAILGALLLSLTYVPAAGALILPNKIRAHHNLSDRFMEWLIRLYQPSLNWAIRLSTLVFGLAVGMLVVAVLVFRNLGAEFIPTLEEGDLAMQMTIQPGSALSESVKTSTAAESILLQNFPEVKHVVSKIGTAEVPTDPMAIEDADIMIILKEKEEWVSADSREELVDKMKAALEVIPGAAFEFTQPIQLRFNELMTGAKTDIAVKIFGEDMDQLAILADKAAALIQDIPGAGDVKVEQTDGLPQWVVTYDRTKLTEYGVDIQTLNQVIRSAYGGESAGIVFENERKFDLVVRLAGPFRQQVDLHQLQVPIADGHLVPLSEMAQVVQKEGPMQVSRENAHRRIHIGINVRNRDVASLVADIEAALDQNLRLPPGYSIAYGGQFENLQKAQQRLGVAVPIALVMILLLLYMAFDSFRDALMIFTAVPLAAIGGVIALWIRGMPFSISAGIGFIALFGVAVLNGIVLISRFKELAKEDIDDLRELILRGASSRLRPVIMTATVAALGFIPMALSSSNGAEVQKPLATVVIGGLVSSTLLTLVFLPVLYYQFNKKQFNKHLGSIAAILLIFFAGNAHSQPLLTADAAVEKALQNHPLLRSAQLQVEHAQLGLRTAKMLPGADFSLELGQVNSKLLDYRLNVQQDLLHPALRREQINRAQQQIQLSESERRLLSRDIAATVRGAWVDWYFQDQKCRILQQQIVDYSKWYEIVQLRYRAGESGRLDEQFGMAALQKAEAALTGAQMDRQVAWASLQRLARLDTVYVPAETPTGPLLRDTLSPAPDLLAVLQAQLSVARAETNVTEATRKPSWTIGYFNQNIRPDYFLQGVLAGVKVPLWPGAYKAQTEQARLQEQIVSENIAYQRDQTQRELDELTGLLSATNQGLQTWQDSYRKTLDNLQQLSELQMRQGESDYLQYFQTLQLSHQAVLEIWQWELRRRQILERIRYLSN